MSMNLPRNAQLVFPWIAQQSHRLPGQTVTDHAQPGVGEQAPHDRTAINLSIHREPQLQFICPPPAY